MMPEDIVKLYIAFLKHDSELSSMEYGSDGDVAYFIWHEGFHSSPIEVKFSDCRISRNIHPGSKFGCHPRYMITVDAQ